jgi:hypothetical protein
MRAGMRRGIVLALILVAAPVLAGGGDWKMGPLGPYWDENSWPEFTPMYWMEEFMNRLDDDDDEIRNWMDKIQSPAQTTSPDVPVGNMFSGAPVAGPFPGTYAAPGPMPTNNWPTNNWPNYPLQSSPWNTPQNSQWNGPSANPWSNPWNGPSANPWSSPWNGPANNYWNDPWANPMRAPYSVPYSDRPGSSGFARSNRDLTTYSPDIGPIRKLRRDEFSQLPRDLQGAYIRAMERGSSSTPYREPQALPVLTRQEFSRLPAPMQRTYKNAYDQAYKGVRKQGGNQKTATLPNMTPQQFSRMPPELQREYEREFEREFAAYQARRAGQRGVKSMRGYSPAPNASSDRRPGFYRSPNPSPIGR